jgi:hypothetical protein
MFQNSNGTTAVTVGDPVGYSGDKSPNLKNAIMATAAQRPLAASGGGLSWLQFDNSNDALAAASPGFTSAMDIVMGVQRAAGDTMPIANTVSGTNFVATITVSASGSSASSGGAGTPTYAINGVAVPGGTGTTRAQLAAAWAVNTPCVLEIIGVDMSAWTSFAFGDIASLAGLSRIYGLIARQALSAAELAKVRTYIGSKTGLTL